MCDIALVYWRVIWVYHSLAQRPPDLGSLFCCSIFGDDAIVPREKASSGMVVVGAGMKLSSDSMERGGSNPNEVLQSTTEQQSSQNIYFICPHPPSQLIGTTVCCSLGQQQQHQQH